MTHTSDSARSFDAVVDTDGVARASRHTLLAQLVTQVSRIAVSVVLARLLTPSDFGVVAAAMVVMVVAWQLTDLGTAAVIIQRDVIDDALVSSLFYVNLFLGVVLSSVAIAVSGPLSRLMGQPAAEPAIEVLGAVSILGAVGNMHYALLRRRMKFGRLAAMNIANAVVSGVVGIGLALAGAGIWALVLGTVVGTGVSTVAAWVYEPWRPSFVFRLERVRAVARFGVEFFLSSALATVFAQLDKVVISRMLGGAPLGTYTVAQRTVTSPVNTVSEAVSNVSFSVFAREQNNATTLRSGASRAAGIVALVVLPSMVGLAVLAEDAVVAVYGPGWEAAVPVIQVLAPVAALQALSRVTDSVMLAMGRSDWLSRWALTYLLLGAAAMLFAARWGLVGVSLGLAAVVVVLTPIQARMALSLIDMRLGALGRTLAPHVVITAAMAAAAWSSADAVSRWTDSPTVQLLTGVLVGAAVHGVLMWRCRIPALDDARRVLGRWSGGTR